MGLLDKLNKAANMKVSGLVKKKEPQIVSETVKGNVTTVKFDNGFELDVKTLESRRAIFNLETSKLPSFSSERVDLEGGLLTEGKNSVVYIRDGVKVFEVSSRTKAFKELEEWRGCAVKRFIAERRQGDYGAYYKVWMYFGEKLPE